MENILYRKHRVVSFAKNGPALLAGQSVETLSHVSSIDNISYRDILLRNIRVLSIPGKALAPNISSKIKRFLLKVLKLKLDLRELIGINYRNVLFGNLGDERNTVFSAGSTELLGTLLSSRFNIVQLTPFPDEPGKQNLFNQLNKDITSQNINTTAGTSIFVNFLDTDFLKAYKKTHPSKRVIVRFQDFLKFEEDGKSKERFAKIVDQLVSDGVVDEVETYCQSNAREMNWTYRPNGFNPDCLIGLDKNYRDSIIRFLGAPGNTRGSRKKQLDFLVNELTSLYPKSSRWIDIQCIPTFGAWKAYPDYLQEMSGSEIFIDLVRVSDSEGFSFRIAEALFLNRKIITDRTNITSEPFYSKERIFLLGVDPIDKLREFIETDIEPLPKEILDQYDMRNWWFDCVNPNRDIES